MAFTKENLINHFNLDWDEIKKPFNTDKTPLDVIEEELKEHQHKGFK